MADRSYAKSKSALSASLAATHGFPDTMEAPAHPPPQLPPPSPAIRRSLSPGNDSYMRRSPSNHDGIPIDTRSLTSPGAIGVPSPGPSSMRGNGRPTMFGMTPEHGHGLFDTAPGFSTSYGAAPMAFLVQNHGNRRHSIAREQEIVPLPVPALAAATSADSFSERRPSSRLTSMTSPRDLSAPLLQATSADLVEPNGSPLVTNLLSRPPPPPPPPDGGPLKAVVFGSVNAFIGLPALVAFAAIVFRAPDYTPFLGSLSKFFFFSSAVHQLVFVLGSSLPFAIGQVQDVGLIFLSAMASDILEITTKAKLDVRVALGTTLLTLALSTFVVGLLTFLVGRFKLAGLVQYVPLPVVGGYLGYVGYFCLASGAGLGAGEEIGPLTSWVRLLTVDAALKLLPTMASCGVFMLTMEHLHHPLALPSVLFIIPLIFHAVLWANDWTLQDAQDNGWTMKPTAGDQHFWRLWGLYNINSWTLDGIYLPAMLQQASKVAGLFLVVCFGSCMDVAAIQQDMPNPLDFNKELCTVGVSNMVSASLGAGFTGSYIFSQTVFTMRAGVRNRLMGITVGLLELLVFAVPFSVIQYIPNFFFGALLVWFGIEISRDWLVLSFRKLSRAEYVLLWATFMSIMQWELEEGIAVGIVLATLYFAFKYAQSQISSLRTLPIVGLVQHGYNTDVVLDNLMSHRVVALGISGFIFFGSASALSDRIEQMVHAMLQHSDAAKRDGDMTRQTSLRRRVLKSKSTSDVDVVAEAAAAGAVAAAPEVLLRTLPAFVVLDFGGVSGLDATGARTFATLLCTLETLGVTPLFTNVRAQEARDLLAAHGVALQRMGPPVSQGPRDNGAAAALWLDVGEPEAASDAYREFVSVQGAMRHIQSLFLSLAVEQSLVPVPTASVTLEDMLQNQLQEVELGVSPEHVHRVASSLAAAMTCRLLRRGETLFASGGEANELYLIEYGTLRLSMSKALPQAALDMGTDSSRSAISQWNSEAGPGCLVAAVDFYLQRPSSSTAICVSNSCRLLRLNRASFQRLFKEAPDALNLLQVILMRATCLEHSVALDTLLQLDGDVC